MKATRFVDKLTHRTWLLFAEQPDANTLQALKDARWRWSGYRKAWHNPRRGVLAPTGIEVDDGGQVEWAAERADRLEVRADKAQQEADRRLGGARALADRIPLGQPILVGHHSERHARRDAERIRTGYEKGFAAQTEATELARAAERSREHQAHLESPGAISRRLDRLRGELRDLERRVSNVTEPYCADVTCACPDRERAPPVPNPNVERWASMIAALKQQIAEGEAQLADAPALPTAAVGDLVQIRGHVVRVTRVNAKTYSGVIEGGGANGMTGKWDKSWLTRVFPPKARS